MCISHVKSDGALSPSRSLVYMLDHRTISHSGPGKPRSSSTAPYLSVRRYTIAVCLVLASSLFLLGYGALVVFE